MSEMLYKVWEGIQKCCNFVPALLACWNRTREGMRIILHGMCLCAQLHLTLCNPMDCSPPGSSVHGISQARILEWVAIPLSWGPSRPRVRTHISCIGRWILYHWATWEALT